MLLAEPQATQYDLHFRLRGIAVRVSPFFWILAALLGWDLAVGLGSIPGSPGAGLLLLLWISAVFLSILIHEMGHALAMRFYGTDSRVVLYHFGGLAIPETTFGGFDQPAEKGNQVVISAAGPVAQLLLVLSLVVMLHLSGRSVPLAGGFWLVDRLLPLTVERVPLSFALQAFSLFLLLPSLFWAIVNLLPVYPLDGGQIARELFVAVNPYQGIRRSLILSIATGVVVGLYGFSIGQPFLAIMFLLFAYSSYQTLQATSGGGFGGSAW